MFNLSIDDRLSSWAKFRKDLDLSEQPLEDVWEFWKQAPYVPYNNKIDPYYQASWPSPWEIIVDNRYDDFTIALMISWTLKLTDKFKNSTIELQTYVDKSKNAVYNIVNLDNEWLINYSDNGPIKSKKLPDSFSLQNLVELKTPR